MGDRHAQIVRFPDNDAHGVDFDVITDINGARLFLCTLCARATGTANIVRHCASATHRLNLRDRETRRANDTIAGLRTDAGREEPPARDEETDNANSMWNQIDAQFREARPLGSLDDDLNLLDPIQLLLNGVDDTSSNRQTTDWTVLLEAKLDALEENAAQEEERASSLPPSPTAASTADHTEWYPFKSKMVSSGLSGAEHGRVTDLPVIIQELIGSLIMGHTHSMLLRSLYSKIRGILKLCNISLPAWATIQAARTRIRVLLKTKIQLNFSVFDNPCFSLSAGSLLSQVSCSVTMTVNIA
ncbi:hypothetical protein PCASD_13574 [Puccinia coronata f. sp. avenae]|uniref:Uncharacterized protein n=1 Tax=Puccinia coronata f. sp. avenae TaxID=200324 RepID=A0A2N5TDW9_9BASI|nr:hypothetical protein PCASD_13574 [Puccinia coronata f. sp. avenae]